jgi:hypothetical protein
MNYNKIPALEKRSVGLPFLLPENDFFHSSMMSVLRFPPYRENVTGSLCMKSKKARWNISGASPCFSYRKKLKII